MNWGDLRVKLKWRIVLKRRTARMEGDPPRFMHGCHFVFLIFLLAAVTISPGGSTAAGNESIQISSHLPSDSDTKEEGAAANPNAPAYFAWSGLPTSVTQDTLFSVTATAKDNVGGTLTGYTDPTTVEVVMPFFDRTIGSSSSNTSTTKIYNTAFHDSRAQVIYTAAELGSSSQWIGAMAFSSSASGGQPMLNFTIRMKHTDKTSFDGETWEAGDWTTVLVTPSSASTTTFHIFNTPFFFNGTQNLMIDVSFNNTTATTAGQLRYVASAANRVLSGTSNSALGDPLTWTGATGPTPVVSNELPTLSFYNARSLGAIPSSPVPFTSGAWSGPAFVPTNSNSTAWLLATAPSGGLGFSNKFTVISTTVVTTGTATVFSDGFETGALGPAWNTTDGSRGTARTQVTLANTPRAGVYHLTMDTTSLTTGTFARNAPTLTIDLAGRKNVSLEWYAKGFSEEGHAPATVGPFGTMSGYSNSDSVAISPDGVTWVEVAALRGLPSSYGSLSRVILDPVLQRLGWSFNSTFRLRFSQYDDQAIPSDGIAIDDVAVRANPFTAINVALPSTITEGTLALPVTITLPSAPATSTSVSLTSSAGARLSIVSPVTVPAGQTSATTTVSAPDDSFADVGKSVYVTATASGFTTSYTHTRVIDNETPVLTVTLPPSVAEGGLSVTGTVTLSRALSAASAATVYLSSSDTAEAVVSGSVNFAAGSLTAGFTVSAVNDSRFDGTRSVSITASSIGMIGGSASIDVLDNESTQLVLALPAEVREAGSAGVGTVTISGMLESDLSISLTSADPAMATVPSSVIIPAGSTTAGFSITAVDDAIADGAQTTGITASAAGYASDTKSVTVLDNDASSFAISAVPDPQPRNLPFAITITAKDGAGDTQSYFNSGVTLRAFSNGMQIGCTPSLIPGASFQGGAWTGNVTITTAASGVVIEASTTGGALGLSNSFDVVAGSPVRLAFSLVASPHPSDTPLNAQVFAADSNGALVNEVNGPVVVEAVGTFAMRPSGEGVNADGTLFPSASNSRSQMLYTSAELSGGPRVLRWLAFNVASVGAGSQTYSNLILRLKHASGTSMTDGWDASGWTTVYQGTLALAVGQQRILFQSPFSYNGSDPLMLDVSFDGAAAPGGVSVTATPVSGADTRRFSFAGGPSPPHAWSGGSPTPTPGTLLPNMTFGYEGAVLGSANLVLVNGTAAVPLAPPGSLPAVFLRGASSSPAPVLAGEGNLFSMAQPPVLAADPPVVFFSDGFEAGAFGPQWTITGTANHRTIVTNANGPRQNYHLLMDAHTIANSRNEATLTLDLSGKTGVTLSFWMKENSDEDHAPPSNPFSDGADFDGVAISPDGVTWLEVQPLRGAVVSNTYKQFSISLDSFLNSQGWTYGPAFKIRFNHFDNSPWASNDGFAFDDVSVSGYLTQSSLSLVLPTTLSEGTSATAQVSISSASTNDTVVTLDSNLPGRVILPGTVTIPGGSPGASFTIACIEDGHLTGPVVASIRAMASGVHGTVGNLTIADNETLAGMSLTLPSSINEGETKNARLDFTSPALGDVQVAVSADLPSLLVVPSSVTMPGGSVTMPFPLNRPNNFVVLDDGSVVVTASAVGGQASGAIAVLDNEPRTFSLEMPASFVESGAPQNATIKLPSVLYTLGRSVDVTLTSSSDLQVPPTISMPQGANSAVFPVTPVDNNLLDGTRTAQVTASAPTFSASNGMTTVSDDDAHHFTIDEITTQEIRNRPFNITIRAITIDNKPATAFQSTAALTASLSGAAVPVSPVETAPFVSGVWTGPVALGAFGNAIVVTATSQGITGSSGPIYITTGWASRLVWDQFPTTAVVGQPFNASIHVDDGYGNTVSGVNAPVVFASGNTEYVGDDDTYDDFLLDNISTERRSTCIYRASELGGAGKLRALGISYHGSLPSIPENGWNRWTIRVKHTQRNDFSAGNPWETAGWTTVFQGSFKIAWEGWLMFPFLTSFDFNGTDNLLVDFSFDNDGSISGGYVNSWMYSDYPAHRSAWGSSSSDANGDPLAWSGSIPTPTYETLIPSLRLIWEDRPAWSLASSPANIVNSVWQGTINVTGPSSSTSLQARALGLWNYNSLQGRSGAIQIALPPPVLGPEPPFTGGGGNTIGWTAGSNWPDSFLAQRSVDPTFTPASSTAWDAGTQALFPDLPDGQTQHYRVKSRTSLDDECHWWTQTITTGFVGSVTSGVVESNGKMILATAGPTEFHEDFEQPGAFLNQSIFSEGHLYGSATSSRSSLSGIAGVPSTTPPLPINQGGDLEARMTASSTNPVVYFIYGAWNLIQFSMADCTIEGYLHMVNPVASTASESLVLRSNRDYLHGYAGTIQQVDASTWSLKLQEMEYGYLASLASASFPAPPPNAVLKLRFSVTGATTPVLRASLWVVTTNGSAQIETPVVFPGGVTQLEVTDTAYWPADSGYPAIHGTMNQGGDLFFDDITITSSEPLYQPEGFLVSPLLGGQEVSRWGVVDWNATTYTNTSVTVDVLNASGVVLATDVPKGSDLGRIPALSGVKQVKLRAKLATTDQGITPSLNSWEVSYYTRSGSFCESLWSNVVFSTQDATAPALAFTPLSGIHTTQSSFNLVGTGADSTSGLAFINVNGVTATTSNGFANWNYTLPGLSDGANFFTVTAGDNAVPPNIATYAYLVYRIALPGADPNGDGVPNLVHSGFNLDALANPRDGLPQAQVLSSPEDGQSYLSLKYRRRVPAGGFVYRVETSTDFATWDDTNADVQEISATPNGDGATETVTVRVTPGASVTPRKFVRLRVTLP